jgi:anti-anti-sigma factor
MVHIDTDTTTKPNVVQLVVQGQLDLTAVSAFNVALTRAARSRRPVELNLAQIDFIDGCGLSTLMNATRRAQRGGHELTIVAASRYVRRLIDLTDSADRLPPFAPAVARRGLQADAETARKALDTAPTPAFRI